MILKASSISQLINEVYDGVERSRCGKIIHRYTDDPAKDPVFNTVAYTAFIHILDALLPKDYGMKIKEDLTK